MRLAKAQILRCFQQNFRRKLARATACYILDVGSAKCRAGNSKRRTVTRVVHFALVTFISGVVCASAAEPKHNWTVHCAQCHGTDGKGKTKMGEKLGVKDLTDPALHAKVSDADMVKTIKNGIRSGGTTKMKAYGDLLTDEEIGELVKLIRGFKK